MDTVSHRSHNDLGPGPAEHIDRRDQLQFLDAISHQTEHAFGHENNLTQRQALATDSCARVESERIDRLEFNLPDQHKNIAFISNVCLN
jgi:hypothetical protein